MACSRPHPRVVESRGAPEAIAGLYATDALLDVNVPRWRFQREEPDEIAAHYADWYGEAPGRIEHISEWAADWGSLIESAERGTSEESQRTHGRSHVVRRRGTRRPLLHGFLRPRTEARQQTGALMHER